MTCSTPQLNLPSVEKYGNFTAEYRIAFHLDHFDERQEIVKDDISDRVLLYRLPPIRENEWPPYGSNGNEILDLNVGQLFLYCIVN